MDSLKKRLALAANALNRLRELTEKETLSAVERDALIQRFEFCFEIMWKCGKDYLLDMDGLDAASPRKVIRLLREVGVLDDEETEQALSMAGDRNLTAHTYDEKTAITIATRICDYEPLMRNWHQRMAGEDAP
ncbi:MAG: HI0074 family nucleotidyltransferase substrate-binding subunit [Selenomonadaceae bacterium]|nr:HI0074 family nucleotidyltransferase substrate-binding subunit [Selenomonadaceae bacterium]